MYKYGLVHLALLFAAYYMFGFIYGIVALVVFIIALDKGLDKIGYSRLTYMDLGCAYEIKCNNNHIGGYMEIEKIGYDEFKDVFVERALTKIRKLRKVLVQRLGFFLWKDIDMCDAMDQIKKVDLKLNGHEDIVDYICKINDERMDRNKPLWEFRVIENYTADKSLIIYRIHHTVLDGVGFGCLMSTINDNQFSSRLNKKIYKPSFLQSLKIAVTTPLTLAKVVPDMKKWCTDPQALKLSEINGDDHFANKYFATKEFEFKHIVKCYKKYPGMTFNDFMLAIIGKSYDQWFKEHGVKGAEKIGMIIPVNLRDLPTSYDDLQIDNAIASAKFELPIKSDMGSIMETIKPTILRMTSPEILYASLNLLKCIPYFPEVVNYQMFEDFTQGCDVSFSNIPFSDVPWVISGKKVTQMTFFNNLCLGISMALMGYTYDGKVRFSLQTKKNQKMDAAKLMEYIVKNVDEEIKKAIK
jgi:diacylglycerol O-acyltransferase